MNEVVSRLKVQHGYVDEAALAAPMSVPIARFNDDRGSLVPEPSYSTPEVREKQAMSMSGSSSSEDALRKSKKRQRQLQAVLLKAGIDLPSDSD